MRISSNLFQNFLAVQYIKNHGESLFLCSQTVYKKYVILYGFEMTRSILARIVVAYFKLLNQYSDRHTRKIHYSLTVIMDNSVNNRTANVLYTKVTVLLLNQLARFGRRERQTRPSIF
jgi:hypothetical protein